jgi:hypothetical protein
MTTDGGEWLGGPDDSVCWDSCLHPGQRGTGGRSLSCWLPPPAPHRWRCCWTVEYITSMYRYRYRKRMNKISSHKNINFFILFSRFNLNGANNIILKQAKLPFVTGQIKCRIRWRIRHVCEQIRGSGSAPKFYGSRTLNIKKPPVTPESQKEAEIPCPHRYLKTFFFIRCSNCSLFSRSSLWSTSS